jgi:ferritin-like metal-binding protein YciE
MHTQIRSLSDVLTHGIMDLYDAERQLLDALPQMAEKAQSEKLKRGFEKHIEQTEKQMARLEEAASELGVKLNGFTCAGMAGLIEESQHLLEEEPSAALDAALITAAQKVEHYEIASYGSAVTMAEELDNDEVAELLKETLDEEEKMDKELSKVAEDEVNRDAAEL